MLEYSQDTPAGVEYNDKQLAKLIHDQGQRDQEPFKLACTRVPPGNKGYKS